MYEVYNLSDCDPTLIKSTLTLFKSFFCKINQTVFKLFYKFQFKVVSKYMIFKSYFNVCTSDECFENSF